MKVLQAAARVHDLMLHRGMSKKEMDQYIQRELAYSLANELIKEGMDNIIIKRTNDPRELWSPSPGETEYRARVHLLTPEEYAEYQSLLQFQKQMQSFVNIGGHLK